MVNPHMEDFCIAGILDHSSQLLVLPYIVKATTDMQMNGVALSAKWLFQIVNKLQP